jgi:hypothetical protein
MSEINTGGPAFPAGAFEHDRGGILCWQDGMTLRDYFAAKAMQTLLIGMEIYHRPSIATQAYAMADAMLAEREVK